MPPQAPTPANAPAAPQPQSHQKVQVTHGDGRADTADITSSPVAPKLPVEPLAMPTAPAVAAAPAKPEPPRVGTTSLLVEKPNTPQVGLTISPTTLPTTPAAEAPQQPAPTPENKIIIDRDRIEHRPELDQPEVFAALVDAQAAINRAMALINRPTITDGDLRIDPQPRAGDALPMIRVHEFDHDQQPPTGI